MLRWQSNVMEVGPCINTNSWKEAALGVISLRRKKVKFKTDRLKPNNLLKLRNMGMRKQRNNDLRIYVNKCYVRSLAQSGRNAS